MTQQASMAQARASINSAKTKTLVASASTSGSGTGLSAANKALDALNNKGQQWTHTSTGAVVEKKDDAVARAEKVSSMHALTEEEALKQIQQENSIKNSVASVDTSGIQDSGLKDLAKSDPSSFGLVEALLKKQALGMGPKPREAHMMTESGSGGSV